MQLTDLSSRVIPANEYRRERWRNQLGWTREILRLGDTAQWALRLSIAEIEQDAAFSAFPGIDRELVLLRGNGMRLMFGSGDADTDTDTHTHTHTHININTNTNTNTHTNTHTGARTSGSASSHANGSATTAGTQAAADARKGAGPDAGGAGSAGDHAGVDGSLGAGERLGANVWRSRGVDLVPPYQRVRFAGEEAVEAVLLDGPTQDFNLMWRRDLLQIELLHRPLVGTMLFFADPGSAWAIHLLAGQASFGRDSGLPPLAAGDTAWLSTATRTRYVLDGGGELLAIRVSPLPEH
ncbi:HutD family protein [Xanthomonas axonopodis pv. begoniae]|nr:HutD family protein [Xanthomonas axonopodis pv. begoniae]MBO9772470.1 HutD family protein [Xanthomonas axonopodis pv. begoniae]PPT41169.1 HutD-family protein [Xanthomonas axonopodis pv. begoniae]